MANLFSNSTLPILSYWTALYYNIVFTLNTSILVGDLCIYYKEMFEN